MGSSKALSGCRYAEIGRDAATIGKTGDFPSLFYRRDGNGMSPKFLDAHRKTGHHIDRNRV